MKQSSTLSHSIGRLAMVVSSLAVLIAAMAGVFQQYQSASQQIDQQLRILAQAMAFNIASPGMFGDEQAAHEALDALQVDPNVISARFVLVNQKVLAEYYRKQNLMQSIDKKIAVDVSWKNEKVGTLLLEVNLSSLHSLLVRQIGIALIISFFALIVAGLLAQRFTKIITRPLRSLSEVAQSVGVQGDYSMRVKLVSADDEVGFLTQRFNAMLDRIETQDSELRKQHELLELRVEERTTQLREETQKAEAASRAKSEFLAVISHEIRTPLNGILGMTNLLLETTLDSKQKRFARVVRSSGEDLLTIINDVLDFSKIEAGHLELEPHAFQLNTLIEDLAERYAPIAQGKGLELLCHTPIPPISIEADSARLAQVLTNLLSNAIKFTAAGEVKLSVERVAETDTHVEVNFGVKDTGIGITEEQQKKLFNAFTQADSSMTRKYGGTGLGLVISQRLVMLMGGEIVLNSVFEQGSSFSFSLRFPKAQEILSHGLVDGFQNLRVLVVDDNQTNLEILEYWLTSWGITPVLVDSAEKALTQLHDHIQKEQPFHLLLTDWMMPNMDGGELISALQADSQFDHLSIVVLSSAGMIANPKLAARAMYLLKPVRQSELHNAIAASIRGDHLKNRRLVNSPLASETNSESFLPKLKGRVLLAEDNLVNQEVAMAILQNIGVCAKIAANGEDALHLLAEEVFDVVLMDCQMPIMDGFEATQRIRTRERTLALPHMPIIALTANAIVGDREVCLSKGMDDYLSKPFSAAQLHKTLAKWLPQRDEQDQVDEVLEKITLDSKVLSQLKNLKPGLLVRVIELYLQTTPALLLDMDSAALQQDAVALYKAAHSLKNSSANLGVIEMTDVCRLIEECGRAVKLDNINGLIAQIKVLYRSVVVALEKIKDEEGRA